MNVSIHIQPISIQRFAEIGGQIHLPAFGVLAAGLLFNVIEKKAGERITGMLREKVVPVTVNRVSLRRDESGDYLESIRCSVDEIDYGRLVMMYLPKLEEKLTDEPIRSMVAEIAQIVGKDGETLVRSLVRMLGEEKTARILRILTQTYQHQICFAFNQKLQEMNLPLTVTGVEIEPLK